MSTTTSTADGVEHEYYCIPQPNELTQRMEIYSAPCYAADGKVTREMSIVRCIECGAASYDGVSEKRLTRSSGG